MTEFYETTVLIKVSVRADSTRDAELKLNQWFDDIQRFEKIQEGDFWWDDIDWTNWCKVEAP